MSDLSHQKLFQDFFIFVATWNQLERQAKQLYALWFGCEFDGFLTANEQNVAQLTNMLKAQLRRNSALRDNQFCLNFIDGFCALRPYRNFLVHETWGFLPDSHGELKLISSGVPKSEESAIRFCHLPFDFVTALVGKLNLLMSLAAALQRDAGVQNEHFFGSMNAELKIHQWPENFDTFMASHQILQRVVTD